MIIQTLRTSLTLIPALTLKCWTETLTFPPCRPSLRSFRSCQIRGVLKSPSFSAAMEHPFPETRRAYFDDMFALSYTATVVAVVQEENGRQAVVLDATVFHPQGGGQPADKGFIQSGDVKFVVDDVRSKDDVIFHYGNFVDTQADISSKMEGHKVSMQVDAERRSYNSRLHSAGHLFDACLRNLGVSYLSKGISYHFPDGPYVEYMGIPLEDQVKLTQEKLEKEANVLISAGGKVVASVLPYHEADELCEGDLRSYVSKPDSTPRVIRLGNNRGVPCGGTHVADIRDIGLLTVNKIRTKKQSTKVFYNVSLEHQVQ